MIYDKRAVKILFDTYWGSGGWKSASKPGWTPETPPDDLAFATQAGLMFPSCKVSHEEALQRLATLRAEIPPRNVGSAFISSLSTNRHALKSALGSLAAALHMPVHPFSTQRDGFSCDICGAYESNGEQDLSQLNFERHKWGGVRHTDPFYIAFDLDRFIAEPAPPASRTDEQILASILEAVEAMPVGARLADLVKAIAPIVPGNNAQRRTVIEIFGYAGVLRIPDYPGFFRSFTPVIQRKETPWSKDDWPYPVRWWRGGNGIDQEAVTFWFGNIAR
jgi:hypothetical protein